MEFTVTAKPIKWEISRNGIEWFDSSCRFSITHLTDEGKDQQYQVIMLDRIENYFKTLTGAQQWCQDIASGWVCDNVIIVPSDKEKRKLEIVHGASKHLDFLGIRVQDKITEFDGIVVSVAFDLYGRIQALINLGRNEDGVLNESQWFDINSLKVVSTIAVMPRPNYEWDPI